MQVAVWSKSALPLDNQQSTAKLSDAMCCLQQVTGLGSNGLLTAQDHQLKLLQHLIIKW